MATFLMNLNHVCKFRYDIIFDSHITINTKNFELDPSESKHISKVLRKRRRRDNFHKRKGLEWNGKLSYNKKNKLIAT